MFNMLKRLNNKVVPTKIGGSLFLNLTPYLRDIGVNDTDDVVIINSENQLRAFSEVKIITIEKYTGEKK